MPGNGNAMPDRRNPVPDHADTVPADRNLVPKPVYAGPDRTVRAVRRLVRLRLGP